MQNTQNSEKPLVSFIIAYYNLPVGMLIECINSILALSLKQTEREIIVIDDGSDESPLPSLSQYIDDITYIRQSNKGLSMARNMGINICNGKYIQFVDGDDYLLRVPYEHCLDIARFNNPDVVMFGLTDSPDQQATAYDINGPIDGATYMRHNNIKGTACGYLFLKSLLINLEFTPGIYHEDEEFTPQLILKTERLFTTNATAYYYRKREASIIHNNNKRKIVKRLDDAEQIIIRLNTLKESLPISEREALQRRVAQLTMDYIYNIMCQTKSKANLEKRIARLEEQGLFPLPDKKYTKKYDMFRRATKTKTGRTLLMNILPFMKREQ